MTTIIFKNLTASPLLIATLGVSGHQVAAFSEVTLTDGNTVNEIQDNSEIRTHISNGDAVLILNGIELSQSESLNTAQSVVSPSCASLTGIILGDLKDVDTTTIAPQVDYVLGWNGSGWDPRVSGSGGGGGASSLDELSDVILTAPASGQNLTYNGTNWINGNASFINIYEAGTTALSSPPTVVDFDTIRVQSSDGSFTLSGGETTVNLAGIYRVSYGIEYTTDSSARSEMATWLELNAGEVPGTRRSSYHRNASQNNNSTNALILISLSAGDTLRVMADHISGASSGGDTNPGDSTMTVEFIAPA